MADVFISYSRSDAEFVRRLYGELEAKGHACWVDWEGIPPTAEWMVEIEDAIRGSNAFLAVLSPDWQSSDACSAELSLALRHRKRIIPVQCRVVNAAAVPADVARLNWVVCLASDAFTSAVEKVELALSLDLDHVRMHTRLEVRASDWQRTERDEGLLLRGEELRSAERWIAGASAKDPRPTALQTALVGQSRAVVSAALGRDLVRQAAAVLESSPADLPLATLLAIEAVRRLPRPETQQTLYELLALTTRRRGLITHAAGPVLAIAFSLDSNGVVSRSRAEIKIWHEELDRTFREWQTTGLVRGKAVGQDTSVSQLQAATPTSIEGDVMTFDRDIPDEVTGVYPAPPTKRIAFTTGGRKVLVQSATEDVLEHAEPVTNVAFSPAGRYIATLSKNQLAVWDGVSLAQVARADVQDGEGIAFSPDERYLAVGQIEAATVIGLPDGRIECTATHYADFGIDIAKVAISAYGMLATGIGETVRIWKIGSDRPDVARLGHGSQVNALAFSPDGVLVAIGGADGLARVWDWANQREVARAVHGARVTHVIFSPDGRGAASASDDGTVAAWEITSRWRAKHDRKRFLYNCAFSVAADASSSACFEEWSDGWRVAVRESGFARELMRLPETIQATAVAISATGGRLAVAEGETLVLREVPSAQQTGTLRLNGLPSSLTFGSTERYVASGKDETLEIWDVERALSIVKLDGADGDCTSNFVGLSESVVAYAVREGGVHLHELPSGRRVGHIAGARRPVTVSSDGRLVAASDGSGGVRVVDWEAQRDLLNVSVAGGQEAASVAFSRDGRRLAVGAGDTCQVWDASSGKELHRSSFKFRISAVALRSDGSEVMATSDQAMTAQVRPIDPDALIREACHMVQRVLTPEEWSRFVPDEEYQPGCAEAPVAEPESIAR